jgi:uncharacterized protein
LNANPLVSKGNGSGPSANGSKFVRLFRAIEARRGLSLAITAVVFLVAGLLALRTPVHSSLAALLPDGEAKRATLFLAGGKLANTVAVAFQVTGPETGGVDLQPTVEAFGSGLDPALASPSSVVPEGWTLAGAMGELIRLAPLVTGEDELRAIEARTEPAAVEEAISGAWHQLLMPGEMLVAPMIRNDPLGIYRGLLDRLGALSSSSPQGLIGGPGILIHEDGRHALLLLDTGVSMSDSAGSRKLVEELRRRAAALPPGISADIVCAHVHSLSNEEVLRRDLTRVVLVAGAAFLAVFVFVFRDLRTLWILVVPLFSSVVALVLTAGLLGNIAHVVIGFGTVIVGLTVDFGIYVHSVLPGASDRASAVGRIVRPVVAGAATTVCVFVPFLFSQVDCYRQIALFSATSVVLAATTSLFLLPLLLSTKAVAVVGLQFPGFSSVPSRMHAWVCVAAGACVLVAGAALFLRLDFRTDLDQMDGTEARYLEAETRLETVWGTGVHSNALLAVPGIDLDSALEANEAVYEAWCDAGTEVPVFSLAPWLPSRMTREANAARWNEFWTPERIDRIRTSIAANATRYNFATDAFAPFLEQIARPADPGEDPGDTAFSSLLRDRFVQWFEGRPYLLTLFPDRPEITGTFAGIAQQHPGAMLVSGSGLTKALASAMTREALWMALVGAALVTGVTYLTFGEWRMTFMALVPGVAGLVWGFGVVALTGRPVNVANMIAGIVLSGVCVDHGIFMTSALARGKYGDAARPVTHSAVTTVIGSGSLLFAQHPVLFSVGITITSGIIASYFAALVVVPALAEILILKNSNGGTPRKSRHRDLQNPAGRNVAIL